MKEQEPRWADLAISTLLRAGVITSVTIVLLGLVLTFIHHPRYVTSHTALRELTDPKGHYPHGLEAVRDQALDGRGEGLVMVGLLLLIATPVARVAFSIAVFSIEKDGTYVVITIIVLLLLATSFVLGAAG
ncbi:MAG TPA: DUF1634 domain-containing protein [Thermoanaerobaculia bacterium]|nr:DUF1634 domain-containing protein [Thermoanaerobaculia bacterium]